MLAAEIDGLHPAVVALMRLAAKTALARGRKVSVCGGLAGDRVAIPLLIGLGVSELSLPPSEVAETKALIRTLSVAECRSFAQGAATYKNAAAIAPGRGGAMAASRGGVMRPALQGLQGLGRALMLPIAVLPVAGLLLRLGQADLLNLPFIAAAGNAIFSNLGLIFATGVAVGFARENNGSAGLAAVVGYLVATEGAKALIHVPPEALAAVPAQAQDLAAAAFKAKAVAKLSMPTGILSGLIAGGLYNRLGAIKLPEFLAFFGGRRFVPIASGLCGLGLAAVLGFGWPVLEKGIDGLSFALAAAGPWGLFAYGLLNRLLIVTGLHHILNNVVWFILGDFKGATGDLHRFFAGDPHAGAFMTGFFPVMMFGLPAACLAMYHAAPKHRRSEVGGLFLSMALTTLFTGVTEPIEFTFMFLAPGLYAVHAVLTGVAMAAMEALGVHLGFGFSAGLFDYALNYSRSTRPLWLLPFGVVYAAIYYGLFRWAILRFDLPTPGREKAADAVDDAGGPHDEIAAYVQALGGAANLLEVEACTTRLRLRLRDGGPVDEATLRRLGAKGVIRPSPDGLQVVLGPDADRIAGLIRNHVRAERPGETPPSRLPTPVAVSPQETASATAILQALGGPSSIGEVLVRDSRLFGVARRRRPRR